MGIEILPGESSCGEHRRLPLRFFTPNGFKAAIAISGILAAMGSGWAANSPRVTILEPSVGASLVAENASLVVEIQDDEPMPVEPIPFFLNGVRAQGSWFIEAQENERRKLTVTLLGALVYNQDYEFEVIATDSDGLTNSARIYFDTFDPESVLIEAEDYNFESGLFIDHPILLPEGEIDSSAYGGQVGTPGVDFHETTLIPVVERNAYRPLDTVGVERSTDLAREKFLQSGGPNAGVYDYAVTGIREGEWLNYGRGFPRRAYLVRMRQSLVGLPESATLLSLVSGDPSTLVQGTVPVGVFLGRVTDGRYRTIPLTDALARQEVVLRLTSDATVRLTQLTDDPAGDSLSQNFMVFIPTADPGILRPIITQLRPWPGEVVPGSGLEIGATLVNRDTAVEAGSIEVALNGEPVIPTVMEDGSVVTLDLVPPELPAGSTNTVELRFADIEGVEQTLSWSFLVLGETLPRLESASQVTGPYAPEPTAIVDAEARIIRSALTVQAMYYRLSLTGGTNASPLSIDSIRIEGTDVVMGYSY
jgi:hypothetical protein